MGFLTDFGAGDVLGAANDFYQNRADRKLQEKEGKADRRQKRDRDLIDLLLESLLVDYQNAQKQARFDLNKSTGFLDEMLGRQTQRLQPRPPATSFRAPGEAPAQGPGQGTGSNAGVDYSQMGIGSFQAFQRMKQGGLTATPGGQSPFQGPVLAQDPIQALGKLDPKMLNEGLLRQGSNPGAITQGRAAMGASVGAAGAPGMAGEAPVDPEEENRKKLTKIFSELLSKGVGI